MRTFFIICLAFLLTSCGFELRKPINLSEHIQTIDIYPDDPYRPLQRTVRETLTYSGVEIEDGADIILKLQPEEILRSTYAVDTAGDVAQEQLTYQLHFELVDKSNRILMPMQTIKSYRILYIHENQLLSVNREERTLIDDMRQEAVMQLLRRLAAYDEN